MEPAAERLLDTVVAPLAEEPELQVRARGELAGRMEGVGAAELEAMERRFAAVDEKGGFPRRRLVCRWVVGLVAGAIDRSAGESPWAVIRGLAGEF